MTGFGTSPAAPTPPDAPDADLERGRELLARLRWTGRHVELNEKGVLAIRPRLGTADPFGQDVEQYSDDIAHALAAERDACKRPGDAP